MKQPVLHNYHMGEGVTAFSTTRQGGYSEGRYGEFNINRYCGDSEEAIGRNRQALTQLLGIDDAHLLMPHQVHLTEIAVVGNDLNMNLEGYDALMTDVAGVCIGVSTADCIPVLLYDRRQRAVCAIHAGWRGTVKRIAAKAVARMTAVYGTQPQDVIAQIGPGIHLDSFEVGDEVYDAFAQEGFDMSLISKRYPAKEATPGVRFPSGTSTCPSATACSSSRRAYRLSRSASLGCAPSSRASVSSQLADWASSLAASSRPSCFSLAQEEQADAYHRDEGTQHGTPRDTLVEQPARGQQNDDGGGGHQRRGNAGSGVLHCHQ